MPNDFYGPPESVIAARRMAARRQMANSILAMPGMNVSQTPVAPQAALASRDLYKAGLGSYLSGDQNTALNSWKKASALNPADLEAKRGVERLTQQMMTGALTTTNPNAASADNYRQGLAAFLAGDEGGAVNKWEASYGADNNNIEAKRGLERMLQKLLAERAHQ